MKKNQVIDLGLTGYDELFMNDQERADIRKPKVEEIPLTELTPFKDHPFKVKNDEEMTELMKSIADSGVLAPALARPKDGGGYELISGHRRLAACSALGMETMPVIIRNLTDEEAVITMVDSNLQREHILPSEKAFAYKMKLEAIKHQGKASTQLAQKLSVELVGDAAGESKDQVRRYGTTSINNWCKKGHLKAFKRNNMNHIPKVYLIEFCCSIYFRTITRKSDWHIRALQEFPRWQVIRGLKTQE